MVLGDGAEWALGKSQKEDLELGKFEPHHFCTLYTHINWINEIEKNHMGTVVFFFILNHAKSSLMFKGLLFATNIKINLNIREDWLHLQMLCY